MSYYNNTSVLEAGYYLSRRVNASAGEQKEEVEIKEKEGISLELATVYQFFTFVIIFGNFVPISLYVTLDMVKAGQSLIMNNDLDLYDMETDTPTKVKSLDLNEELGSVDHVFSDKTGTLTCNVMEFMKCSVGGKMYGMGITEVGKNVLLRAGKKVPDSFEPQLGDPITNNVNFVDPEMWRVLRKGRSGGSGGGGGGKVGEGGEGGEGGERDKDMSDFSNVEEFCLHLSLNHDVAPERGRGGSSLLFHFIFLTILNMN